MVASPPVEAPLASVVDAGGPLAGGATVGAGAAGLLTLSPPLSPELLLFPLPFDELSPLSPLLLLFPLLLLSALSPLLLLFELEPLSPLLLLLPLSLLSPLSAIAVEVNRQPLPLDSKTGRIDAPTRVSPTS